MAIKKKVWSKRKMVRICGICNQCGKEMLSDAGGWIINAEHKYFCHSLEKSCFDEYLAIKKPIELRTQQYRW